MGKAVIGGASENNRKKRYPLGGGGAHVVARGVSLFDSHRERLSTYELVGYVGYVGWIGSSRTVLNCT